MARIEMEIDGDGAAFDEQPAAELARILRGIADRLENDGDVPAKVYDVNGNACGYVFVDLPGGYDNG